MKYFVLLTGFVVMTLSGTGWAQEWRDSLNYARKLYKGGKYKEALKYYKSAERLAPNDVDLSEEKGQSAYRAGDFREAETSFRKAVSFQKDIKRKAGAWNNVGSARMKQENYAGAEEAFKEALRLDPSNDKIRQNLAEAKRLRKKQEEQQQNQNQNQNQGNKNKQQQQQGNQGKEKDKQQQNQQQNQQSGGNNSKSQQSGSSQQQQQSGQQSGGDQQKLSDKQTERKLNELMRQEMDAKKRLDGSKGKTNGKKAKKDW